MGLADNELRQRLLSTFQLEAEECLKALSVALVSLEQAPSAGKQMPIIESVYREAHSLKGASRAVNMPHIEALCQALESIFAALKRRQLETSSTLFDTLHATLDTITTLLTAPDRPQAAQVTALVQRLGALEARAAHTASLLGAGRPWSGDDGRFVTTRTSDEATGQLPIHRLSTAPSATSDPPKRRGGALLPESPQLSDTVRISAAKLEALFVQAEEMLTAKLMAAQRVADLHQLQAQYEHWRKEWTHMATEIRRVQRFCQSRTMETGSIRGHWPQLLEFLSTSHTHIAMLDNHMQTVAVAAERDHRALEGMVNMFLEDMKQILMLPFSSLLDIMPKMVRDLARDQGKEVALTLQGGEVEMDRRILEAIKDPLMHILRNSIDHGIELPAKRLGANKPPHGTITITVSQIQGSKVEILVADDGAGIHLEDVKAMAVQRGMVTEEEVHRLRDREVLGLIFQADMSTSPTVTTISGRGLGLAIVRDKVEGLGGSVSVDSETQRGTTFRLLLPVTLATFRGILVQVADRLFVLPTAHTERVMRTTQEAVRTVDGQETISLPGEIIPLVRLGAVLELPDADPPGKPPLYMPVVILGAGDSRMAFRVDAILDELEVLVKGLGKPLSRVRNIAGATVLGSDHIVPILHIADVLNSARNLITSSAHRAEVARPGVVPRRAVLVVEDSPTSRTLLQNILQAAGYNVQTAVDGVDALAALHSNAFDIVVSDIAMPRMNGFDLTVQIRRDRRLAHVPVVLVSSLASPQDRQRGIEVGADAYIAKHSVNEHHLLEVIRTLV